MAKSRQMRMGDPIVGQVGFGNLGLSCNGQEEFFGSSDSDSSRL